MKKISELLTNEEKNKLRIVHLNKGETLYLEGDECLNVGLVYKGEIRIVSYLEDGKEIVYNVIKENQMFGNNLVFSSEPYFRGDVIASVDSYLYLIHKDTLLKILKENDEFLIAYLNAQSDFGKSLNLSIKLLTLNNARERVLYYLKSNQNNIQYISITNLAKELFLSREVLSRSLHDMERKGIIKINNNNIVKL